jgi:hypothetical protein
VAAQLAGDRRHREARERDATLRVKTIQRLEQPQGRHLHQIVERLVASRVPAGDRTRQRQVALDEQLTRILIARPRVAREQPWNRWATSNGEHSATITTPIPAWKHACLPTETGLPDWRSVRARVA